MCWLKSLCRFHPRVTSVALKKLRSFCQKCRWQVNLNTHTPLSQRSQSGLTVLLSRHSVGTYQETSSHATCQVRSQLTHLAEPLWTYPGIKSRISVCELISTLKKKKHRWGMNCWTFSQNPRMRWKSHHHHQHHKRSLTIFTSYTQYIKVNIKIHNSQLFLFILICGTEREWKQFWASYRVLSQQVKNLVILLLYTYP